MFEFLQLQLSLQTGQQLCNSNQGLIQLEWNMWKQGIVICSSPFLKSSKQMAQFFSFKFSILSIIALGNVFIIPSSKAFSLSDSEISSISSESSLLWFSFALLLFISLTLLSLSLFLLIILFINTSFLFWRNASGISISILLLNLWNLLYLLE